MEIARAMQRADAPGAMAYGPITEDIDALARVTPTTRLSCATDQRIAAAIATRTRQMYDFRFGVRGDLDINTYVNAPFAPVLSTPPCAGYAAEGSAPAARGGRLSAELRLIHDRLDLSAGVGTVFARRGKASYGAAETPNGRCPFEPTLRWEGRLGFAFTLLRRGDTALAASSDFAGFLVMGMDARSTFNNDPDDIDPHHPFLEAEVAPWLGLRLNANFAVRVTVPFRWTRTRETETSGPYAMTFSIPIALVNSVTF